MRSQCDPTLVILVVGLTPRHLGPHTPKLSAFASAGAVRPLTTVTPAVTCSVQATFMTGGCHAIMASSPTAGCFEIRWRSGCGGSRTGWWEGEKIWEAGKHRDASFTTANLFWWYNMAASHDIGVTPRPIYKSDGRKLPDCYTQPPRAARGAHAEARCLPAVPFLGPGDIDSSSRWIADAALHIRRTRAPTLTLVYLPHLDYDLQRFGPDHPRDRSSLREIDAVAGDLIADAERDGARVIVLSEYGITAVSTPIHINRALREAGPARACGSRMAEKFSMSRNRARSPCRDHQIAHIYVADPDLIEAVRRIVARAAGRRTVLDRAEQRALALDHPRSGELVAIARADAWFTYYYWLDERRAPDFARLVEIHRKPGYDPVELYLDPAIRLPKLAIGWRLAKRALGMRTLMDVIPLDANWSKVARPPTDNERTVPSSFPASRDFT